MCVSAFTCCWIRSFAADWALCYCLKLNEKAEATEPQSLSGLDLHQTGRLLIVSAAEGGPNDAQSS